MSKTVEIVLTKTVKIGGQYRYPGEELEVTKKQALEIRAAGSGYDQPPALARSLEKARKKPEEDEGGDAQGGTSEGQGGDDASGLNAEQKAD